MHRLLWMVALLSGCSPQAEDKTTDSPQEPSARDQAIPEPEPEPEAESESPEPREAEDTVAVSISAGKCNLEWLPPPLIGDVPPEETQDLVAMMASWLSEGSTRTPLIETRRGVAHAKSKDDLGADPPYPSFTQAQSRRVCDAASIWLRDNVRTRFARHASPDYGGVTCERNACCYTGMEYLSSGIAIFRRKAASDGHSDWVLAATLEVADQALGAEYVAANRNYVARELARLERRGCPSEPPGFH